MPPSIDVLTISSAPAWPTAPMALKYPLPSPNVMVPKQSFETRRPVLPSIAYSMAERALRVEGSRRQHERRQSRACADGAAAKAVQVGRLQRNATVRRTRAWDQS